MYKVLLFFLFIFITANPKAAIFEPGDACAGARRLVSLANEFDGGTLYEYTGRTVAPAIKPIYDQLKNVDRNRRATTGDVEAVFKTILTIRYHRQAFNPPTMHDPSLNAQFNAYRIMDMACEILMETPSTIHQLRFQTIRKARVQLGVGIFTDDYIAALIPDVAVTMVQHPESREEPSGYMDFKRHIGQNGILLGRYDEKETLKALQAEKDQGKALYLVLGRGNRQPTPGNQKTTEGKDIVWIYLDADARCHSTNLGGYFLWEDFNDNLGRKLTENFFDAVIFDNSVTKFICSGQELTTVIWIAKVLTNDGSFVFPPSPHTPGLYYEGVEYDYRFPFPYGVGKGDKINRTMLWPEGQKDVHYPGKTILKGDEELSQKENLYKTFNDCLQLLFEALFREVALIISDVDLASRSKFKAQYDSSPARPIFWLANPKKTEIQAHPFYGSFYQS